MSINKSEAKWILYLEGIEVFLKYKGKSKWTFREMAKSDLTMFKDHKTAKRWYQNYNNKQMVIHERVGQDPWNKTPNNTWTSIATKYIEFLKAATLYFARNIEGEFHLKHVISIFFENEKISYKTFQRILHKKQIRVRRNYKQKNKDWREINNYKEKISEYKKMLKTIFGRNKSKTIIETNFILPRDKNEYGPLEVIEIDCTGKLFKNGELITEYAAQDAYSGARIATHFDLTENINGYRLLLHKIVTKVGLPTRTFKSDQRRELDTRYKNAEITNLIILDLNSNIINSSNPKFKPHVEGGFKTTNSLFPLVFMKRNYSHLSDVQRDANYFTKLFNEVNKKIIPSGNPIDPDDHKAKMILFKNKEFKVHVGEYFYIERQELAPYDKEGKRVPMIVGSNVKLFYDVVNKKWVYKKGTRYYNLLPINGKYIDHTRPLKNNHSSNLRYQIPSHFDRKIKFNEWDAWKESSAVK